MIKIDGALTLWEPVNSLDDIFSISFHGVSTIHYFNSGTGTVKIQSFIFLIVTPAVNQMGLREGKLSQGLGLTSLQMPRGVFDLL